MNSTHPRQASLGPLWTGAKVALVATSGPPPVEELDRSIALVRQWGLEPIVYPSARATHPRAAYLAGSDAVRAADLQRAWCDTNIDAVFCVRGGYGSVRILDLLDRETLVSAPPKPLFGSSDVTAVHEYWYEQLGVATWFSPMLATAALLDDEAAKSSLHQAIFEPVTGREFSSPTAATIVPGEATGVLSGGNLSLIAMTQGARLRPPPSGVGRIVLLEDVAEEPYRIDGMLTQLLRAGWFDTANGIALGSWHECGDQAEIRALVGELLIPLGIPLVWDLGFGHAPKAHSLPLGIAATLIAGTFPTLRVNAATGT